jgi:23S rRNA (guanosine2251-2'-O)-methyltransferase
LKTRRQEPPGRDEKGRGRSGPTKGPRDSSRSRPGDASPPRSERGDRQREPRRGGPPGTPPQTARRGTSGPATRRGRRDASPEVSLTRQGRELLYGRNAVLEALRGRRGLGRLYVAEGVREDERLRGIIALARERGSEVEQLPRPLLDDATRGANHQGVALEVEPFRYAEIDDVLAGSGTVLVLDHMQDPQNMGTLLRAAEAAAVDGVVIPENRSASISPAVVNASSGAVEHLRVAAVPNLARTIDVLKRGGRWVIGLDAGPGAQDLYRTDIPLPVALVVGAEGSGLSAHLRSQCDLLLALPMRGRVASLNAATAGAIALYELMRREGALSVPASENRVAGEPAS